MSDCTHDMSDLRLALGSGACPLCELSDLKTMLAALTTIDSATWLELQRAQKYLRDALANRIMANIAYANAIRAKQVCIPDPRLVANNQFELALIAWAHIVDKIEYQLPLPKQEIQHVACS